MATPRIKGGRVKSIKALKNAIKKGNGGDHYIKRIPKDDSLSVRFLTEPEDWFEYVEYFSEEDGFFPEVEGMPRSYVEGLNPPSKRWLAAAVDVSDNSVISLVIPKTLAQSLYRKYEKWSTLMDREYELVREGEGFDTKYEAIAEAPSKFNLNRFTPPDLGEVLAAAVPEALGGGGGVDDDDDNLADVDDDDDETPLTSRARRRTAPPAKSRRPAPDDDEDDDDDTDDAPAPRRTLPKKSLGKRPAPSRRADDTPKALRNLRRR